MPSARGIPELDCLAGNSHLGDAAYSAAPLAVSSSGVHHGLVPLLAKALAGSSDDVIANRNVTQPRRVAAVCDATHTLTVDVFRPSVAPDPGLIFVSPSTSLSSGARQFDSPLAMTYGPPASL